MIVFAVLIFLVGLYLFFSARSRRKHAGFGQGETVSNDDVQLESKRFGLRGKPDRIIRDGRYFIPEEKKPGSRVYDTYKAQLGVYLVLVEEKYGVRPPYGVIVLGDGRRVKIKNAAALRARVLEIAENIRAHRKTICDPLPPPFNPRQCVSCGQRPNCAQRLA